MLAQAASCHACICLHFPAPRHSVVVRACRAHRAHRLLGGGTQSRAMKPLTTVHTVQGILSHQPRLLGNFFPSGAKWAF